MYKPSWKAIVWHSVKQYIPLIVFFVLVLLAGTIENVNALMSDVAPLQSEERGQDVQVTRSVWVMQPSERVDVLQPTYNELQGSTYEW